MMTNCNPIQLVRELKFKSNPGLNFGHDTPESLRISPNGQHIALSSDAMIFLFHLSAPEAGWQQGVEEEYINCVAPTDSGGYWVSQSEAIQFIDHSGQRIYHFAAQKHETLWGNDHWLLTHDGVCLRYANTQDFSIINSPHKYTILHAWEHESCIRLLSISKKKKYLYLHEWYKNALQPTLIKTLRCKHDFFLSGINACYLITKHIHAWPDTTGGMLVKLLPWAVTVAASGEISISDDHVAWHPVHSSDHQRLSRQKLAELTACSLDQGFDPGAGLGSTPFLITTLDYHDSVHFISTNWHKKLLKTSLHEISDEHLNENLDDLDVATLVLANSGGLISEVENMVAAVIKMSEEKKYRQLLHQHQAEIGTMFVHMFPKAIDEIIEANNESLATAFDYMFDAFDIFSKYSLLPKAFFSALYGSDVSQSKRNTVESLLFMLIPTFSKKWQTMMPACLLKKTIPLIDSVRRIETEAAIFLLRKAPAHFFNGHHTVALFNHFCNDADAIDCIFEQMMLYRCKPHDICPSNNANHELHDVHIRCFTGKQLCNDDMIEDTLLLMLKYGFSIPQNMDDPRITTARLLQHQNTTSDTIAELLACLSLSADKKCRDFVIVLLAALRQCRLLPTFICTMSGLLGARNKRNLESLANLGDISEHVVDNKHFLIASLWQQTEHLGENQRWAYAVCLLAATTHCMGNDSVPMLMSGHSSDALLTAEARLLQKEQITKSNPVEEIFNCIASEYGMDGDHKKVSEAILQQCKVAL